ncbi:hypothetical protein GCM10023149_54050 [Mucilaginibacter gynuensis]|uniref:peptide-methionine (S)-S-oxide reductase n=2 Tax=Mucilaginibacter gynuensis TaxID=1302236 RepID=A0ABP8HMZ1_9SPHI
MSLKGVTHVEQGWIAADGEAAAFSEAVIVTFNLISLSTLITVHLHTHSCTSNHSMRSKYRSAIYTFNRQQEVTSREAITALQPEFAQQIITEVLPFREFKRNTANYLNYYYSNPEKPFCKNVINPKLRLLLNRFSNEVDSDKFNMATV